MQDYFDYLELADRAARKAGDLLKANFGRQRSPYFKSEREIGLPEDTLAEEIILDLIRRQCPAHSIYSEEAGHIENGSDYQWVVDPLDGTANYFSGIAHFSVSIALLHRDETVVGLVHHPMTGQTYSAVKGNGAHLDGTAIGPSQVETIKRAVVSFVIGYFSADTTHLATEAKEIASLLRNSCRRTLSMWAPALDWALLAAGGIDALVSFESETEDQFAGTLIAQEAGCIVTDFDGRPYFNGQRRLVATNPILNDAVRSLLQIEQSQ
ncbi:MAG: inositol monophosphatase [Proteobacteria bacterium]|nr:inositol monophosphatase [Pseudomonadota bacterium]